jgi:hypothetical protein
VVTQALKSKPTADYPTPKLCSDILFQSVRTRGLKVAWEAEMGGSQFQASPGKNLVRPCIKIPAGGRRILFWGLDMHESYLKK